jgi:general L-amino acid transport system substrate-binding protein
MPVTAPELGLGRGWQEKIISDVGNHGEIFNRNLGKRSTLNISRGLNANHINGGL